MAIDYKSIGKQIKKYRTQKGISQEELGRIISVNSEHLSRVETGRKYPSLELTIMIANALEVSVDDLLGGNLSHPSSAVGSEMHALLVSCNDDEREMLIRIVRFMRELFTEFGI